MASPLFDFKSVIDLIQEHAYLHHHRNIDIFKHDVLQCLSDEWKQFFESHAESNFEMIFSNIDNCSFYSGMPESLVQFVKQCRLLTIRKEPDNAIQRSAIKGVKQKKVHEILQMSHLVNQLVIDHKITRVVDVGCGQGYLLRTIAESNGSLKLAGIEMQKTLCDKLLVNLSGNQVEVHQLEVSDRSDWSSLSRIFMGAQDDKTLIVSLHGCGDLSKFLCRMLKDLPSSRNPLLVTAPCCYHKSDARKQEMTLEEYSMSSTVKRLCTNDSMIWGSSLRLACHPPLLATEGEKASGDDSKLQESPLYNRAYLEIEKTCDAVAAVEDLQDRARKNKRLVHPFLALQGVFQGPLESLIIMDRVEYLKENGSDVQLHHLFSSSISPRNMVIVAINGSQCYE